MIGKQSLSSKIKLVPGKIATKAARTNVPAQVGCTRVGQSLQWPENKEAPFSLDGAPPVEHDCATTPLLPASEAIHPALSHVL